MPPPFPGMDPYIESQKWPDFHVRMITELGSTLTPHVRPRYEVEIERRIYVERLDDESAHVIKPDVAVSKPGRLHTASAASPPSSQGSAVAIAPVLCELPVQEEKREAFLTIRELPARRVVAVIELLSPDNKRATGRGRKEYLRKREALLDNDTHLIELDLLRGGSRMPMHDALPLGDYFALICRAGRRRAEVYAWPLAHRLPLIPVPLAGEDPDVSIDLQSALSAVYDRAGYDYSLRYDEPVEPPLDSAGADWVAQVFSRAAQ